MIFLPSTIREMFLALQIVRAINFLREEEGSGVTVCSDNPDFDGLPNCAIDVCGSWTDWNERRFAGDTVLEALQEAVASKRESEKCNSKKL